MFIAVRYSNHLITYTTLMRAPCMMARGGIPICTYEIDKERRGAERAVDGRIGKGKGSYLRRHRDMPEREGETTKKLGGILQFKHPKCATERGRIEEGGLFHIGCIITRGRRRTP